MTTMVYKYGLRSPITGSAEVDRQILAARRYYNRLIEIELDRRNRYRELRRDVDSEIEMLEAWVAEEDRQCELAATAIKMARQSSRRRADTEDQRQQLTDARSQKREVLELLRARRAEAESNPAIKEGGDRINEEAHELAKEARSSCGCFWGTYLITEQAVDAAKKSVVDPQIKLGAAKSGAVAVQLQRGLPAADALSGHDRRLQIVNQQSGLQPGDRRAILPDPDSRRSQRRQQKILRLRVGSDGRDPVWAEWPMIMHRPLPVGSQIMWAKVVRERIARSWRWSVHLTLTTEHEDPRRAEGGRDGVVAVDLGWRKMGDNLLRVAYVRSSGGQFDYDREVVLDTSGLTQVDDLKSIRDQRCNALKETLIPWLRERKDRLPPWLAEQLPQMGQWRGCSRFWRLASHWKANRFDGDDGYLLLAAWATKDQHLWEWHKHLMDKSRARRLDQYRVLSAMLAREYRTLVIEQFDLHKMIARLPTESKEVRIQGAATQQQLAACSILRTCLVQAFAARGGRVVELPAANTTRACGVCGSMDDWEQANELAHRCSSCQTLWDQDRNACDNLLARYCEHLGGAPTPGGARVSDYGVVGAKRESKWGKRGRHQKRRSQNGSQAPEIAGG